MILSAASGERRAGHLIFTNSAQTPLYAQSAY